MAYSNIVLFFSFILLITAPSAAFVTYPEPTGPYRVGVKNNILIQGGENSEQFTVSVYYPAESLGTEKSEPLADYVDSWQGLYSIADNADKLSCAQAQVPYLYSPFAQAAKFLAKSFIYNMKVPVKPNLPILRNSGEKFPVIILSHGQSSFHAFHLALILDLASHGFIVAAIDHTCTDKSHLSLQEYFKELDYLHSEKRKASNGNMDFWKEELEKKYKQREAYTYKINIDDRVNEFDQTIKFFLETTAHQKIYQSMNLDKIGIVGQSLGGQAALESMVKSTYKERIKAVVSLDGCIPIEKIDVRIPTLSILAQEGCGDVGESKWLKNAFGDTKSPLVEVHILEGSHSDFSDISVLWHSTQDFHDQYSKLVLEFLKRTLN